MPYDLENRLVIGVSSRALFDLTVENDIFEKEGVKAYSDYTIAHESEILKPGPGFSLIKALLDIGKKSIFAGDRDEGLVHEEDCALRLSKAVKTEGAHFEGPSEGKVVMISDVRAMLRVNTSLLEKVNSIGDITITTLPDHYRVEEGARLL